LNYLTTALSLDFHCV